MPAETRLDIIQSLALLASQLGLPDEPDLDKAAAAVRPELGRRNNWLLVFDNAEDPADLHPLLPSGDGKVLVTSRKPVFAALGTKLEIDVLPHDEAVEFLLNRTGSNDRATAERLAEKLGRLPLALAQVAGYLDATPGVDLAGYLERFDSAADRLLKTGVPPDYPAPVASTWQLNIDELSSSCPAAVDLLRLCAFLAPETPIPMALITAKAKVLPKVLRVAASSDLGLDEAVAALYRFSLVTSDHDGLRVHRLVQAVTRHRLGRKASRWHDRAVRLVLAAFPNYVRDPDQWSQTAAVLPHAQQVTQDATKGASAEIAAVLQDLGSYLRIRGEMAMARETLEQALEIMEQVYGVNHREVALTLNELATVLGNLGELAPARGMLQRALHIFQQVYGVDHPKVAQTMGNLGLVLYDLEEFSQARGMLEPALQIYEREYGVEDIQLVPTLGNLALMLRRLGELGMARVALQRVLHISRQEYGIDSPEVVRPLYDLGLVLRDLR